MTQALLRRLLVGLALGTAAAAQAGAPVLAPLAGSGGAPQPPWQVVGLPRQGLPATRYSVVDLDGQRVLRVDAAASYGNLVHALRDQPGAHLLRWRWRLDTPNPAADLRRKDGDDSPLKVCVLFDLPITAVPFVERQVLRIARLRAGDQLPAASVCYVWDARLAPGTVLDNAYTRRVRLIVLRGPESPLHTWQTEQRDVRADFLRLFGDEAPAPVPLVGVAIAGDADNTQGHSVAHIGAISFD
ncbi:MAG: DUF3047 domain-containing protein [Aquabacterium sp.]|nr:DUF3047 domain-containing protein [Aquabacterium sp.]